MSSIEYIYLDALQEFKTQFTSKNINGYGVGLKIKRGFLTDRLCLFVTVEKKLPPHLVPAQEFIPPRWRGLYTDVVEVGKLTFLQFSLRYRPVLGGTSAFFHEGSAGSHCLFVVRGAILYSLSCTHTYAWKGQEAVGQNVIQPSPFDGGTLEDDSFAVVREFIPLQTQPPGGIAEGAIAEANIEDVSFEICEYGAYMREIAPCRLGVAAVKVGRTTGLTKLKVSSCSYSTCIEGKYYFHDQILLVSDGCPVACQPGDSGAPVVELAQDRILGMLIAGSQTYVVASKMQNICSLLSVSL